MGAKVTYLLAEDPGIRGTGVALFEGIELLRAAYVPNPCTKGNKALECQTMASAVKGWVELYVLASSVYDIGAEWPLIVHDSHQKGSKRRIDKNDLLALAGVSAAFAMAFPHATCRSFIPRDWKGTVDPDVMTRRIAARLSPKELDHVEWRSRLKDPCAGSMHNVFDAIGIGLFMLGRLKSRKRYAGIDVP